jgi:hypothetical protein
MATAVPFRGRIVGYSPEAVAMLDPLDEDNEVLREATRLAALVDILAAERIEDLAHQLGQMPGLGRSFRHLDALPSASAIVSALDAYRSCLRRLLVTIPQPTPFGTGKQPVSPHFLYALGQELAPGEPSDAVTFAAAIAEVSEIRTRVERLVRATERATRDAQTEMRPASDMARREEARGAGLAFEHAVRVFGSLTGRKPWAGVDVARDTVTGEDAVVLEAFLARMGFPMSQAAIRKRLQKSKLMGTPPERPKKRSSTSSADQS